MKILHLIQRYEPAVGGSEIWCREVARWQAACGHRVRVLTLDIVRATEFWTEPAGGDRRFRLGRLDLDRGVEVRRFRRSLPIWTLHHLVLRLALDRLLNIFLLGPHSREMLAHLEIEMEWTDVVHLHAFPYPHNVFGLRAARRVGRPVVITPHLHVGHPDYERPHLFRLLRRADRVAVLTHHEEQALARRGVPPGNVTVTGCGLPGSDVPPSREEARTWLSRRLRLPAGAAVVACVARKTPEKGLEPLVRAVSALRARGRNVVLALAGPPFEWFDRLLAGLPEEERRGVFDLGEVTSGEKARLLAGADLFAMPSRYEAFGIVFLEAWQAGLPVIGGNSGAQPEVIGEGGRTVPFGDVTATAEAIAFYLEHPDEAARAARRGQQSIASRFRWEHVTRQVLACYREIVPALAMSPPATLSETSGEHDASGALNPPPQ